VPRGFRLLGSLMRRPPGLGPGASSVWTRRGGGLRFLKPPAMAGWSLAAAYRQEVEGMPTVKPDAESGGPSSASPRFPATRTLSLMSFRPPKAVSA